MVVSWDTEWSHSRCPAATTCLTRSGWACACVPTMQNVALTPYWRSTSSTWGVHSGSGPSSMVMLTPRAPWSEACAMSTATVLTALPGLADVALGDGPPNAPACAVHTEAPAASNVTPSAAPSTLVFQPRPPCRAMSVPPSRSSRQFPGHLATTWQDERQRPQDASVTDQGQFRGGSRTTGQRLPCAGRLARTGEGRPVWG